MSEPASLVDWVHVALVDMAEVNPESLSAGTASDLRFRYIDLSSVDRGEIDWSSVQELTFAAAPSRARRLVRPGDVLFGTVRPALQSHGAIPARWADGTLVASTGFSVIRARRSTADQRFLFHFILSDAVKSEARRVEVGSNYPAVNEADVRRLQIPKPPLPVQHQIAEILDTINEAILGTEQLIAKLQQIKQGLLHDLLARGIGHQGEIRDPNQGTAEFVDSLVGRLPKGWRVRSIRDIATVRSGATPPRKQASRYFSTEGHPWVKTLDLNEGYLYQTDERVTEAAMQDISIQLLPRGTVLIAMYGGWEQIGRTAILAISAATNQAISAVLPDPLQVSADYLLMALQDGRPRWKSLAASTRKDPNITKSDVLNFFLPIPPLEEQVRLAKVYDSMLERIQTERDSLSKLRLVKSGLMEELLSGRVRVSTRSEGNKD